MEEVNENTKKLGDDFKKPISENENIQKVVPIKIDSDDEDENIKANIRALPNSNKFSIPMKEMFGALMNSRNSLKIYTGWFR